MKFVNSIVISNSTFLLIVIILVSIFFRTYQIVEKYGFAHDAELFSWIVKDIVVNQHPRLIGQLTSAPGIFIGPLFYYSLVPFFMLFNMDPVGALIPITIVGILTTFSYFFVFSKLFNKSTGLIAAFFHATLLQWISFDRLVVPSTPTNLWVIWYFFTIIQISRGNIKVLPILGILLGLIWHIHIALLPTLVAIPVAFFISGKLPKIKELITFSICLLIPSLPLILFETRHNFSQTLSLISNFTTEHGGVTGFPKLIYILKMIEKNINSLFISPQSLPENLKPVFVLSFILAGLFLIKKKIISKKDYLPITSMALGVILFFTLTSSLVSEYYIYSLEIIFVAILSLLLSYFLQKSKTWKIIALVFLVFFLGRNIYFFTNSYTYKKGYLERKNVVEFITKDAGEKGYPCIGISYITTAGENTGFRYFFYLKNTHLVHPSLDVPVYNIVIPDELSPEVIKKFEHIGIIPPTTIPSKEIIEKTCSGPNTNLTDPLFGYVD